MSEHLSGRQPPLPDNPLRRLAGLAASGTTESLAFHHDRELYGKLPSESDGATPPAGRRLRQRGRAAQR